MRRCGAHMLRFVMASRCPAFRVGPDLIRARAFLLRRTKGSLAPAQTGAQSAVPIRDDRAG